VPAVVVLCLVQFVDVLGVTSAVVAIPAMLEGVRAPASWAGPLATAYAMFFGGLLVLGARLGQRYGHRRVLLGGLAVFAAAGLVGALATGAPQLVVARAVQGASSALTVPAALSLLLASAPGADLRRRALAAWSAAGAAAGASGFVVGGAVTDLLGWPAVFWVTAPVALVLAVGVLSTVRLPRQAEAGLPLDLPGAGLLTAAVAACVAGAAFLEEPASRAAGAALLVLGAALGTAFARWLRRARSPVVPPAALRERHLVVGAVGSFVNTAATSSPGVLLTLHLQQAGGLSAAGAGAVLVALSLAVVPGSAVAPVLVRRTSLTTAIATGLVLLAVGNVMAAASLEHLPATVAALVVLGLGLGLSSVGCNDLGTDVPQSLVAAATGVLNTAAQLGTALGVAATVLVASAGRVGGVPALPVALLLPAAAAVAVAVLLVRARRS
jgi:predicted MFS family arabinose efflux permease